MTDPDPIVFVVDDDLSVRRSTERLIRSAGLKVQTFPSAKEFLKHPRIEGPACLVLDVRMPGLSGMDRRRPERCRRPARVATHDADLEDEKTWHLACASLKLQNNKSMNLQLENKLALVTGPTDGTRLFG
jgi:DNA-binding response OmpR family regulator